MEEIFHKLSQATEIAKLSPSQIQSYEESLKYYRDLKNSLDTAKEEGREEGRESKALETAKVMLESGESIEKIMYCSS